MCIAGTFDFWSIWTQLCTELSRKVKGFIAVDNTVYDEELAEAMEMEKKYMLQGIDEFQKIKNSFSSLEEFQMALKTDPDKYGAALPQVSGYTYTESDREEYIQAYSLSSNDTIRNEVNGMDQSLLSIKNKNSHRHFLY